MTRRKGERDAGETVWGANARAKANLSWERHNLPATLAWIPLASLNPFSCISELSVRRMTLRVMICARRIIRSTYHLEAPISWKAIGFQLKLLKRALKEPPKSPLERPR